MWPTTADGTPQWKTQLPAEVGRYFCALNGLLSHENESVILWADVFYEYDELPDGEQASFLCAHLVDGNHWIESIWEFIQRYQPTHWLGPLVLPPPPKSDTVPPAIAESDNA